MIAWLNRWFDRRWERAQQQRQKAMQAETARIHARLAGLIAKRDAMERLFSRSANIVPDLVNGYFATCEEVARLQSQFGPTQTAMNATQHPKAG